MERDYTLPELLFGLVACLFLAGVILLIMRMSKPKPKVEKSGMGMGSIILFLLFAFIAFAVMSDWFYQLGR